MYANKVVRNHIVTVDILNIHIKVGLPGVYPLLLVRWITDVSKSSPFPQISTRPKRWYKYEHENSHINRIIYFQYEYVRTYWSLLESRFMEAIANGGTNECADRWMSELSRERVRWAGSWSIEQTFVDISMSMRRKILISGAIDRGTKTQEGESLPYPFSLVLFSRDEWTFTKWP